MSEIVTLICCEFLEQSLISNQTITVSKLQRLLYFTQGIHFVETQQPIVDELFLAWDSGPSLNSIHQTYKHYRYHNINVQFEISQIKSKLIKHQLTDIQRKIISQIWLAMGHYDTKKLEQLTHMQKPWQQSYNKSDKQIQNITINKYFNQLNNT